MQVEKPYMTNLIKALIEFGDAEVYWDNLTKLEILNSSLGISIEDIKSCGFTSFLDKCSKEVGELLMKTTIDKVEDKQVKKILERVLFNEKTVIDWVAVRDIILEERKDITFDRPIIRQAGTSFMNQSVPGEIFGIKDKGENEEVKFVDIEDIISDPSSSEEQNPEPEQMSDNNDGVMNIDDSAVKDEPKNEAISDSIKTDGLDEKEISEVKPEVQEDTEIENTSLADEEDDFVPVEAEETSKTNDAPHVEYTYGNALLKNGSLKSLDEWSDEKEILGRVCEKLGYLWQVKENGTVKLVDKEYGKLGSKDGVRPCSSFSEEAYGKYAESKGSEAKKRRDVVRKYNSLDDVWSDIYAELTENCLEKEWLDWKLSI